MLNVCEYCRPSNINVPKGLPKDVDHLVCENKTNSDGTSLVTLRGTGATEDDAKDWLKNYSEESRTVWRIQCAHPESGRKNVFKTEYRCQHNTRHKRSGSAKRRTSTILKNTECPAKLTILVKRVPKRSRSLDKHLPQYPMVIQLKNSHNHAVDSMAALRHRDVNPEVRLKFEQLYLEQKHSPGSALGTHIHDLHQIHSDAVFTAITDRSLCPDRGWCYSVYYKVFNKEYRERIMDKSDMDSFGSVLQAYDKMLGETCSNLMYFDDNEFACVIITPLMRRNHQLNCHAAEMCYIDSSGRADKEKCTAKLYLLLADSEAGGIPLGLVAVSSDTERVLAEAFSLYRGMLQEHMHYKRGVDGPRIFITEDCNNLRRALTQVFPESLLLIGMPHIIQATWRFICNQTNGVPCNKRLPMICILSRLLVSNSPEELEAVLVDNIESNPELVNNFTRYLDYLRDIYNCRELWSPCMNRLGTILSDQQASTVCSNMMGILKDVILHRLRSYNLPQMAHFVFTRMDQYYGLRLQDVVNDREQIAARRRFLVGKLPINGEAIMQTSLCQFRVQDGQKMVHEVDASLGICTCVVGTSCGAPCKHQYAVATNFDIHCVLPSKLAPISIATKIILFQIATGKSVYLPDNWFKQMQEDCVISEEVTPAPAVATIVETSQKIEVIQHTNTLLPCLDQPAPHDPLGEVSDGENQEDNTQETLNRLHSAFDSLRDRYLADPALYGPAVDRFCSSLETMQSDQYIVPALTNFGRYGQLKEYPLDIPLSDWFSG